MHPAFQKQTVACNYPDDVLLLYFDSLGIESRTFKYFASRLTTKEAVSVMLIKHLKMGLRPTSEKV
jgi:hypothetical protein